MLPLGEQAMHCREVECSICWEEGVGVSCASNTHSICLECFCTLIQGKTQQGVGCVRCPTESCTSQPFPLKLIASVVPGDLFDAYLRSRDFAWGKEAAVRALSQLKMPGVEQAVHQEEVRTVYCKADGSYSAYMCRKCRFGPIDHGHCSNLKTHHGQQTEGGRSINNACPKCGWFAANISEWPKWDGQFLEVPAAVTTCSTGWTCNSCTLENPDDSEECLMCENPRHPSLLDILVFQPWRDRRVRRVEKKARGRIEAKARSRAEEAARMRAEANAITWASLARAEAQARQHAQEEKARRKQEAAARQRAAEAAGWDCATCTFHNAGSGWRCAICRHRR